MKQRKSPRPSPTKNTVIDISRKILLRLTIIEELLKKKDDRPLTFKEACTYLGYAPSYLYKLTYKNVIPHYKPTGKMIFFSKAEVDAWIFKSSPHPNPLPRGEGESVKDPNQIEMELEEKTESSKQEKIETEVVIEFPLKSRRAKK